jgi:hypothetical protein
VRTRSLSTAAGVKPSDSYPSTKFNNRRCQRLGKSKISLEPPAKKVLPLLRVSDTWMEQAIDWRTRATRTRLGATFPSLKSPSICNYIHD